MKLYATLLALSVASGCAYVGDVRPPALNLPMTVTDLRALEYGDKVLIEFTLAPLTTEGAPLTNVKAIELRIVSGSMQRVINIPPQEPGVVKSDFPIADANSDWIGKPLTLNVRATGSTGRTTVWSNAVMIAVAPALTKPTALAASATPKGVQLTWNGDGPRYRIFRSTANGAPAKVDDIDKPPYIDSSAEFGNAYSYFAQAIGAGKDGEAHQSEVSNTVSIAPVDTFPPAVPAGVSAVAGVGTIEISWDRNTETDFANYSVYRSDNGGEFEKVTGSLPTPVYSDRAITPGHKYAYAITAVDQAGNESARSVAAEVTAP